MRSFLIHADTGPAMEGRLQTGLDLARATGGHVQLHFNTPIQRFVVLDPFGGAYLAGVAIAEARQREDVAIAEISARLEREDVPWGIEASAIDPVDALTSAARLSDCVVVSLAEQGKAHSGPDVGALAVSARCPILALPAHIPHLKVNGTVMVAWDGSHESANALRAAVPLLALAESVTVVTIVEKADGFPATQALRYLSHYGVQAELVEKVRNGLTTEEMLQAAAVEFGADLIVLGAYGHSRLRETLMGGVTRYLIDQATFALLLVH